MKPRRNLHAWKTRTAENEKREVRAHLFGKKWSFEEKLASEEEWSVYEIPRMDDLVELRRILFNKYQRKHLAWEHVVGVDRMIQERGGEV